jgi:hypothetical protein
MVEQAANHGHLEARTFTMLTRRKKRRWEHLPKEEADEVTSADPFSLLVDGIEDDGGSGRLGVFDRLHNVCSADDDVHPGA